MKRDEAFKKLVKPHKDDKVLLLTHIDMDAAGAEILCRRVFKDITVKHLNNNKMSDGILYNVTTNNDSNKYDLILIDDISCSLDVANKVDELKDTMKIVLLDHHNTAEELNKYSWASVVSELLEDSFMVDKYDEPSKAHSSGASLMCDYLEYNGLLEETEFIKELIHVIAAYDTWDWHNLLGENVRYPNMDKLCDIYGLEDFVDEMYERSLANYTANNLFTSKDLDKLVRYQEKVDEYLESIKDNIVESTLTLENDEYSIAWCFTSSYLQETFSLMKEMLPNKDLYIIDFGSGVSLRTDNPDLHVGMFAKKRYGGGGHPGAAGFRLKHEIKRKCLETIMGGTIKDIEKNDENENEKEKNDENEQKMKRYLISIEITT